MYLALKNVAGRKLANSLLWICLVATIIGTGCSDRRGGGFAVTGTTESGKANKGVSRVEIFPANPVLLPNGNVQFQAVAYMADGSTKDITSQASWATSQSAVADFSQTVLGKVEAVGPGIAQLTDTFGGVVNKIYLTVSAASLSSIEISPYASSFPKGVVQAFSATGLYNDGTKGQVMMAGIGTTQIGASLGGVSASTNVTVTAATLVSVQLTPANASVPLGTSRQITVTGIYSDNSTADLTLAANWTSSDSAVIEVSSGGVKGLVRSLRTGNVTLTADVNGVTTQIAVNGTPATLSSITLNPASASLPKGVNQQISASGLYSDGTVSDITESVTWTTSSSSLATVSNTAGSKGLVHAVAVGNVTITATLSSVSGSATLTATANVTTSANWVSANPSLVFVNNTTSKGEAWALSLATINVSATYGGFAGVTTFHGIL